MTSAQQQDQEAQDATGMPSSKWGAGLGINRLFAPKSILGGGRAAPAGDAQASIFAPKTILLVLLDGSVRIYTHPITVADAVKEFPDCKVGSFSSMRCQLAPDKKLHLGGTYYLSRREEAPGTSRATCLQPQNIPPCCNPTCWQPQDFPPTGNRICRQPQNRPRSCSACQCPHETCNSSSPVYLWDAPPPSHPSSSESPCHSVAPAAARPYSPLAPAPLRPFSPDLTCPQRCASPDPISRFHSQSPGATSSSHRSPDSAAAETRKCQRYALDWLDSSPTSPRLNLAHQGQTLKADAFLSRTCKMSQGTSSEKEGARLRLRVAHHRCTSDVDGAIMGAQEHVRSGSSIPHQLVDASVASTIPEASWEKPAPRLRSLHSEQEDETFPCRDIHVTVVRTSARKQLDAAAGSGMQRWGPSLVRPMRTISSGAVSQSTESSGDHGGLKGSMIPPRISRLALPSSSSLKSEGTCASLSPDTLCPTTLFSPNSLGPTTAFSPISNFSPSLSLSPVGSSAANSPSTMGSYAPFSPNATQDSGCWTPRSPANQSPKGLLENAIGVPAGLFREPRPSSRFRKHTPEA